MVGGPASRDLALDFVCLPDPRRLGGLVALGAAGVALLGASGAGGQAFAFDRPLSIPRLVSGALLVVAAAFARLLALRRDEGRPGRRAWAAVAALCLLLALDEVLALHERVAGGERASAAVLAVVAMIGIAWTAILVQLRAERIVHHLLGAAAVLWLSASLVEAVAAEVRRVEIPSGALVLGASVLLPAGLLVASQRLVGCERLGRPGFWYVASELVRRAPAGRLAVAVGGGIAALALAGTAVHVGGLPLEIFDMNTEQTLPAVFSAALLAATALLAFLLAAVRVRERALWWNVLGWFFAFLAVDEVAGLHEEVQESTGVYGQVYLVPLVCAAAVAASVALYRLRAAHGAAFWLFVGGGVSWVASQAVDVLHVPPHAEFDESRPDDVLGFLIVVEDVAELVGTALFGFALLLAVQRVRARPRA